MSGTIKGIIVEIGGDTSGLQKSLSKVNSQSSSLSKELKGINSLLKLDPKNVELLEQKQTVLNESIEITQDKLKQLKKVKEEADKKMAEGTEISEENYRNLQREIINTERKLGNLTEEMKQLNLANSNWTKAGKKIEEYGSKITKVSDKINDIGNKASIVSGAVIAGGTVLTNSAMNVEDAVAKYVNSTNTAQEETEKYKKVLEDISRNNYGESYEDIADAMSQVKVQLKDVNSQDLKNITEKAIALRDLFGYDVSESIRAVKSMMDNFNISADEAFNLIAEGKKQGLDFSNELIDSVNEYSVQFKKLGLTADDMFNIFKSGAENGAFNLDKIGDAVKEFSIRAIDGSNTTVEGFKKIGLNADKMAKKFSKGGDEAKEAFKEVIQRISKMDNKVEQSIVGVDLFGTMWEDLGPTVITSFSKMDRGISKSSNSMQKSIDGLYNTTKKKAEAQLKRLQALGANFGEEMLPILEKLIDKAEGFISCIEGMSDAEKENLIHVGLLVAGIGPLTKVVGTTGQAVGNVTKGIGTFSQAIGVMKNHTESGVATVDNLAKMLTGITSPAGLATIGITALAGSVIAVAIASKNAEKDTKEAFGNMGDSASDFITGISSAKSHLDSFNSTLFASSEEQQKLQENMNNVQKGITEICKKATDERRGYTQTEIKKLDEYFTKLRELKNRELEIQKSISASIAQQAQQNAQSFQGNLEEYKIQAQEWIATAEEQKNKEISIINDRTTQEIALLQQRYGDKATLDNAEYAREYNELMKNKDKAIQETNDQVAKVNLAYSNGYLERIKQSNGFYSSLTGVNAKLESENNRYKEAVKATNESELFNEKEKNLELMKSKSKHKENIKKIWNEMYKNMSKEQEEELGTWLAMVSQTEMYGGKIEDETQNLVNNIIDSYESMPEDTKKVMQDTMSGMFNGMKEKEPSLFSKASGIAEGILSRLRKSFDIHSPSRKTKEIFKNVMKGAELGLKNEEKNIYEQIDNFSNKTLDKFDRINVSDLSTKLSKISGLEKMQRNLNSKIIENQKTVFTTPQITFNVQELDEAKLQQCFNYVNRKFGSQY